jgi:hypothetical protein
MTTTAVLSYHDDQQEKTDHLARIGRHEDADSIAQGAFAARGQDGGMRYCNIGCSLREPGDFRDPTEGSWHREAADTFGWPLWLARFADQSFEGLAAEDARTWPRRMVEAIPVGVDLEPVLPRLLLWMLTDDEHGVRQYAGDREDVAKAIDGVAELLRRKIAG